MYCTAFHEAMTKRSQQTRGDGQVCPPSFALQTERGEPQYVLRASEQLRLMNSRAQAAADGWGMDIPVSNLS